jgi:dipeptidase E
MAKVFLTSNGFFTESIKNEFQTIISEKLPNPKAVIITTASPHKEANKYAIKAKNVFLTMGIKRVKFLDIEFEDVNQLKQYNVVYINGGNPFNLLHHMKKSGADLILKELVKQNTVIVGVSAGAVILGPNIELVNHFTPEMNKVEMNDLTAIAITDKAIFPHYDREDVFKDNSGKSIEDRLKVFERTKNCSVIRLRDDQYLLLNI